MNHHRCLLIGVYNPHRLNNLESFFEQLKSASILHENIIMCGDFNINLLRNDPLSQRFCDNISACGLFIVNRYPTRFAPNCNSALLDIMACSDKSLSIHFDQLSLDGLSDHDLLFFVYDLNLSSAFTDCVTYRDFNVIDTTALHSLCSNTNWNRSWFYADVNNKLELLTQNVAEIFNAQVPLKTKIIKKSKPPWFQGQVKLAIKNRSKMYCNWKSDPSNTNWNLFKLARNKVHTITRKAKCAYYRKQFGSNLSSKDFWTKLRNVGIKKSRNECNLNPQDMIEIFSSPMAASDDCFQVNRDLIYNGNKLNLISFTELEVLESILSIQSNAVGHDEIHLKFIKLILPFVLPIITHVFNHIIATNIFPSAWNIAKIIPVAKKSTASEPSDYRPISILSSLSKAFEKLLSKQILKHINDNNLLSSCQSGFQQGKSCNTAIIKVFEDIRPFYDKSDLTILVLIDFSKAFDSVNHKILMDKLSNYFGFSKESCKLIKSYLTGRSQFVASNNGSSAINYCHSGVPQGSILGPMLFSIFINDIVNCCKNSSIHLYADDVQIYLSRPTGRTDELVTKLNDDLASIYKWSKSNNLIINTLKTQAIRLYHKVSTMNIPLLNINGGNISFLTEVKNLGFIVNSQLNCSNHINATVQKIYFVLRKLWHIASFLHPDLKLKLVKIFIIPFIIYGSNVYGSPDSCSMKKLQLAINNCARFVYNKRKFDHISHYSSNILGMSLESFLDTRNLLLLHKIIFNKSPQYLYECLEFSSSKRTKNLVVPIHKYLTSSNMFFVNAIKLWNKLPHYVKADSNYYSFKSAVLKIYKTL